ncbi:MAG: PfkB family carbohydrate kinase [Thermoproteota archaeon]|nr:PfkB family carbohydrate kinase [Thermoproteota archaeon]
MRIAIASHIVLDTIKSTDGRVTESIGGPVCYCGITGRRFGFDVSLVTKVGNDLPKELFSMLQNNDIILSDNMRVDAPTTKFQIHSQGDSRQLLLCDKCKPISVEDIQDMKVDCWLASPVIDELPQDVLATIKQNRGEKNFVMLDPQGYLRVVDYKGSVTLKEKLEFDLSGINAIKVDNQEMAALTGGLQGLDGMEALQSNGIEFVIYTEHRAIHLLHKKMHYWLSVDDVETVDSTGVGDILCASFSCAYLKEKDPIWAISFGAGAVKAALETRQIGLAKIPPMSNIEQTASYFYNAIGFQSLS